MAELILDDELSMRERARLHLRRFFHKERHLPRVRLWVAVVIVCVVFGLGGYLVYRLNSWSQDWSLHLQVPIQNFIRIEPRTSKGPGILATRKAYAQPPTFEDKVRAAFGVHAETFLKIAHAESGQNAGTKGWNCRYNGRSTSCRPEDRKNAWSVDCGALQVNVYGTVCPVELFDLDKNLEAAVGKFARQGFKAWSVCYMHKIECK